MVTAATSLLDSEVFEASAERDALNRVLKAISPDNSEVLYVLERRRRKNQQSKNRLTTGNARWISLAKTTR